MLRSITLTQLFISLLLVPIHAFAESCAVDQVIQPNLQTPLEHVNEAPKSNRARQQLIESWWADHCNDSFTHDLPGKRSRNVICRVEGEQPDVLVIGAHFDKVQPGRGVADNWSGVVVLDALVRHFQDRTPGITLEFVAFAAEEPGMFGSKAYLRQTGRNIIAMLNLDTLGLQSTIIAKESDAELACEATAIAEALEYPIRQRSWSKITGDWEPFIRKGIPALSLHSVDGKTIRRIHHRKDRAGNVDLVYLEHAYWITLNLIYHKAFIRQDSL